MKHQIKAMQPGIPNTNYPQEWSWNEKKPQTQTNPLPKGFKKSHLEKSIAFWIPNWKISFPLWLKTSTIFFNAQHNQVFKEKNPRISTAKPSNTNKPNDKETEVSSHFGRGVIDEMTIFKFTHS